MDKLLRFVSVMQAEAEKWGINMVSIVESGVVTVELKEEPPKPPDLGISVTDGMRTKDIPR